MQFSCRVRFTFSACGCDTCRSARELNWDRGEHGANHTDALALKRHKSEAGAIIEISPACHSLTSIARRPDSHYHRKYWNRWPGKKSAGNCVALILMSQVFPEQFPGRGGARERKSSMGKEKVRRTRNAEEKVGRRSRGAPDNAYGVFPPFTTCSIPVRLSARLRPFFRSPVLRTRIRYLARSPLRCAALMNAIRARR